LSVALLTAADSGRPMLSSSPDAATITAARLVARATLRSVLIDMAPSPWNQFVTKCLHHRELPTINLNLLLNDQAMKTASNPRAFPVVSSPFVSLIG
jgi:hypothetical protein